MLDDAPLSDNEAHDRLLAAIDALGEAPGDTMRADTALSTARQALHLIAFGLLYAAEKNLDHVPGVRRPSVEP